MEEQRRQQQAALEAQRAARERAELAQCTFAPAVLPAAPAAPQVRQALRVNLFSACKGTAQEDCCLPTQQLWAERAPCRAP